MIIFLVLIVLCQQSPGVKQLKPNIFPHTLYAYWNKDISLAPTFTQMCINAMRKTTNLSNWDFVLLNPQNFKDYLSEESKQQLQFILDHKKQIGIAVFADLVRIFVLRDNGGMWIDSNSFFLQDLSWIEQISKQKNIENNLSSQPDMIMFQSSQHCGGNRTLMFDERINKDVILFPCLEIWSFITKPRTKFLNDLVEGIVGIYKKGTEEQFLQQNLKQGYQYMAEESLYFIYSNLHFQTLLQRKQREIDANRSAFKQKYAIEYYNIWSFNSLRTAFRLFDITEWIGTKFIKFAFYSSLEQILQHQEDQIYFLKFTSQFYSGMSETIDSMHNLICSEAIEPISQNSIINQFLFKKNEELQIVKRIRSIEKQKMEGKLEDCQAIDTKSFTIVLVSLTLGFSLLLILLIFVFKCLKRLNRKKKQHFIEQ